VIARSPEKVNDFYAKSYTVEFKHDGYDSESFTVSYNPSNRRWRSYLKTPGTRPRMIMGGVGCQAGPASPAVVSGLVEHMATQVWGPDQPLPPPPPPPPAAAAAAVTADGAGTSGSNKRRPAAAAGQQRRTKRQQL
jgi:hypothetical protein